MQQAWRAFGHLIPVAVLGVLVATPAVVLLVRRRRHVLGESLTSAGATVVARAAAIGSLLLVAAVTLEPIGGVGTVATSTNWVPFATVIDQLTTSVDASIAVRNLLFNVLLFVPVGFAWAVVALREDRSWVHAVAAGAGLSVLIEFVQLLLPIGRAVDVDDVFLNSLGALIGAAVAGVVYVIFRIWVRVPTRHPRAR